MKGDKERFVTIFQTAMLLINFIAVVFVCSFIWYTTEKIRNHYEARAFLNSVGKIPGNPKKNFVICMCMMGILILTAALRQFMKNLSNRWIIASLVLEFLVCAAVIYQMDFNYNGLLLLVFANTIACVKDGKTKLLFVVLAIAGYLIADYNLLSIYMPLYNISNYIEYYNISTQQYLLGGFNILRSLNIILFIMYCVYVINAQRGTIEEVNILYHELQAANEQLTEYADMSERMAKTKERNRLAREIHDTLGHTLTGIATGLDACLALMDVSAEQTRKQLLLLSEVSREGIKDIRRSVNELRPDALERLSLSLAIRKMITDMSRASDVQIYFETEEKNMKFDEDEENAIYRIIQESVTNAIRHGKAEHIWISFQKAEGEILLQIKDDGVGCKEIKNGFGTKHIMERIEMLGGRVTFDGQHGFTVTAHIPIRWGEMYD